MARTALVAIGRPAVPVLLALLPCTSSGGGAGADGADPAQRPQRGHGTGEVVHRRAAQRRAVDWQDRWCGRTLDAAGGVRGGVGGL